MSPKMPKKRKRARFADERENNLVQIHYLWDWRIYIAKQEKDHGCGWHKEGWISDIELNNYLKFDLQFQKKVS